MKRRLSLFVALGLIILALVGCTEDTSSSEPQQKEIAPEQEVTQDIADGKKQDIEEEKESRGIPGSHYIDIKLGLAEKGFPENSVKSSEIMNCKTYDTSLILDNIGIMYNCSLAMEDIAQGNIISATFDILNLNAMNNDDFLQYATTYFRYCGSMPYDTMDIDILYRWLDDNMVTVGSDENKASIIIGDAEFTLYGNTLESGIYGMRMLEIRKVTEDTETES